MKKSSSIILGIIIIIVVVAGGYAIFHKSKAPVVTATTKSTGTAVNNAVLTTKTDTALGQYLANPAGQALYTYGSDTSGVSNCTGSCLASWPAYQDTGSTANLPSGVTTIKRTDNGETQYAYNGMPLYTFTGDSTGKVTGNGVSNFSVATPAASTSTPSTTPAPAPSSSNPYNY